KTESRAHQYRSSRNKPSFSCATRSEKKNKKQFSYALNDRQVQLKPDHHCHVRLQRVPEFRLEFLRCRHRLLRLTVSMQQTAAAKVPSRTVGEHEGCGIDVVTAVLYVRRTRLVLCLCSPFGKPSRGDAINSN